MRSLFENKRWIISISVLALGALFVLSAGLRDIPFREGRSFSTDQVESIRSIPTSIVNSALNIPFWMQVSVWGALLLMVVLIALLMTPEGRKRLLQIVIRVAVIYWGLYILFTEYPELLADIGLAFNANNAPGASASTGELPPAFASPPSNSVLSYIVSFAIAVLLLAIAWKVISFWREVSASSAEQPLKQIARIVRSSLNDLSSGRDSTDVIINCYLRMNDAVADKRSIRRGVAVTPAEFAFQLEGAGLPSDAVQRLTRLFEGARYGDAKTGPREINEAVSCLTTILHYCGEAI